MAGFNPKVRNAIAAKFGYAPLDMEEDGLDAEPMQEVDEEGERVPYNTIAKPGSAMPSEALEMGATPEMRQGQADGNLISNMGRAFSNAARGTNAPSDNSGLFSAIDSQNASLVKQGTEDLNRRAKVMQAIMAQKAKSGAAEQARLDRMAAKEESNKRWDASYAQRERAIGAAQGARSDAIDRKADEVEQTLAVPGYERTGEVRPRPEEASNFRDAKVQAEDLAGKLNEMRGLVGQYGSFERGGPVAARMQSLAREIQLASKGPAMYQLGVLTGPDMELLEEIASNPNDWSSLFTRNSTRLAQIDQQLKSVTNKLDLKAKSLGYRKAGEGGGKPKTVIQDGHTYTLNPATGEYE
jgi:hypothetical protein